MEERRRTRSPWIKEFVLLAVGVLAIAFFYILPPNKAWVQERVQEYWKDFTRQRKNLDLEQRKIVRYGSSYTHSKAIAGFFEKKGIRKQVLVMVPAPLYFKNMRFGYDPPEPAVFYYYTGLRTIRPADTNAAQATWYVHLKNGGLAIDSVADRNAFADTIRMFKKNDPLP